MFDTQAMTYRAHAVLIDAFGFALENGDQVVGPEHLLKVLMDLGPETRVHQLLGQYDGLTIEALDAAWQIWELEATTPIRLVNDQFAGLPTTHPRLSRTLDLALEEARDRTGSYNRKVDLEHLLIALTLDPNTEASLFLNQHGVYFENLRINLRKLREAAAARQERVRLAAINAA